jgi:hypothetical protein
MKRLAACYNQASSVVGMVLMVVVRSTTHLLKLRQALIVWRELKF